MLISGWSPESDSAAHCTASCIMERSEDTPTTASSPASPPPRSVPPLWPKIVASFKIMPPDMAFLYQSTEKCGMDGGFSEKLPEMEKCGNLIFGRLQLKFNTEFS